MRRQVKRFHPGLGLVLLLLCACGDSGSPQEIRQLQQTGRFDQTIEPLRELLADRPDDPELNHLYGRALVRTGQPSLAVWPLRKAAESSEHARAAGILLTQTLIVSGDSDGALEAVEAVLSLDVDDLEVVALRGQARLRAGDAEGALADAERVLADQPDHLEMLVAKSVALLSTGQVDEVAALLERLRSRAAELADPKALVDPRLCAVEATFLKEKGEVDAAREAFAGCLEQHPGDLLVLREAVTFHDEQGEFEAAGELLRSAFEAEPANPALRVRHVERLIGAREFEEAERLMLEHTAEQPSPDAWRRLSRFYGDRERWPEAASAMGEAVALYENPPPLLRFVHADLLVEQGDHGAARAVAREYRIGSPMAELLEGKILLAEGDARGALDQLEAGIRLWPDEPLARYLAANAALQLGDFDRAVEEYRASLRADPAYTDAGLELARLHQRQGEVDAALMALSHHLRGHPGDTEALALRARIQLADGKSKEARATLRALRRTPPDGPARALQIRAGIEAHRTGPAAAVALIENEPLDLTLPHNERALVALAANLVAAGRADDALARTRAALDAHPDEPAFLELHAESLRAAGAPTDEAAGLLERALELDPARASALRAWARLVLSSDPDAALDLYDRAAAADPEDSRAAWSAIEIVESGGDDEALERRLRALLAGDPLHARAAERLARLRLEQGDVDGALDHARRAVRLRVGPSGWQTVGRAWHAREAYDAAIEAFENALRREDSPTTRYHLGLALAAAGREDEARAALEQALGAGSFPEAGQAEAALARLRGAG